MAPACRCRPRRRRCSGSMTSGLTSSRAARRPLRHRLPRSPPNSDRTDDIRNRHPNPGTGPRFFCPFASDSQPSAAPAKVMTESADGAAGLVPAASAFPRGSADGATRWIFAPCLLAQEPPGPVRAGRYPRRDEGRSGRVSVRYRKGGAEVISSARSLSTHDQADIGPGGIRWMNPRRLLTLP